MVTYSLAKNFAILRENCTNNAESIAKSRTWNLLNLSHGETTFIKFETILPACTLTTNSKLLSSWLGQNSLVPTSHR